MKTAKAFNDGVKPRQTRSKSFRNALVLISSRFNYPKKEKSSWKWSGMFTLILTPIQWKSNGLQTCFIILYNRWILPPNRFHWATLRDPVAYLDWGSSGHTATQRSEGLFWLWIYYSGRLWNQNAHEKKKMKCPIWIRFKRFQPLKVMSISADYNKLEPFEIQDNAAIPRLLQTKNSPAWQLQYRRVWKADQTWNLFCRSKTHCHRSPYVFDFTVWRRWSLGTWPEIKHIP